MDNATLVPAQLEALPDFVTTDDVAQVMQTTTRTVRRLVARGVLPQPMRFGRLVRWPRQSIAALLA